MENVEYRTYEHTLHHGDRLFLFTDGLPEMTDHISGQPIGFGEDLKNIFRHSTAIDVGTVLDRIIEKLDAISGSDSYEDDLLLVGISLI
jgi:serine phosphatase RsbU (regulator of sigma subunit)